MAVACLETTVFQLTSLHHYDVHTKHHVFNPGEHSVETDGSWSGAQHELVCISM